ncbi:MAG: hypothetical protein KAR06_12190 [Deltaproteobacteria bacterium]|nr:hypothetical protein [Deltaproteobacteria bacterium]
METTTLILKSIPSVVLVLGLLFSVYHNVQNNKAKTENNERKIEQLEKNTQAYISVIDKMMDFLIDTSNDKEARTETISRVHNRLDNFKEKINDDLEGVRKEFVSHQYCSKAMEKVAA